MQAINCPLPQDPSRTIFKKGNHMPCQPWDEKVTLTLADGVPLEVHKFPLASASSFFAGVFEKDPHIKALEVPGSNVAWQNILKRIYPSAPSAIKALTPEEVLTLVPVAHAYDLKCVMEDCALNAKAFTYTLEDGCDNDAFKWIELAGRYQEDRLADGAIQHVVSVIGNYLSQKISSRSYSRSYPASPSIPSDVEEINCRLEQSPEELGMSAMLYTALKKMVSL